LPRHAKRGQNKQTTPVTTGEQSHTGVRAENFVRVRDLYSRLTYAAEDGASIPALMKLSGHTSVRSLAKYARVSDEGLLNFRVDTDPAPDAPTADWGGALPVA
jgi:hypothetical protein